MPHRLRKAAARLTAAVSIAVLLCSLAPRRILDFSVSAQTTSGQISGYVHDQPGAPLANAKVTLVNLNNGNIRSTRTDQAGYYELPFLPPGVYSVTVSMPGYIDDGYADVRIQLNRMNVVLPPLFLKSATTAGSTAPTPPLKAVTEVVPLANGSNAARQGNFVEQQLEALPLGGTTDMRTFDEYALLVPGVSPPPFTPGVRGPGVGYGIGTAGQFSVNGQRARSNNFTVDGSDNNDPDVGARRQGFVALLPQALESIREFQISTLLWDAELGRNFGSQVNAVSKEGSKAFHGQLYGFFTDSALNARNFFDYTGGSVGSALAARGQAALQTGGPSGGKDPFTRTQAGFVFGGPIIKDRTQFFTSFEREDVNASTEQHFSTPTANERDFRFYLGRVLNRTAPQSFGVRHPFPQSSPLLIFGALGGATPLGQNILSLYPLPNNPRGPYGPNTFTQILPADGDGAVFSFKITQKVFNASELNARYNFTDDDRLLPSINRAINSTTEANTRSQNLSLIFDTPLRPSLFNQARFSYGRTRLGFNDVSGSPLEFQRTSGAQVGGTVFTSQTGLIGGLLVEPFSPIGIDVFTFPQGRANNTFQFADSISSTRGVHTLKFGADIRRVQLNSFQDRNYRPQVVYGNGALVTGNFLESGPTPPGSPIPFVVDGRQFLMPGVALAAIGLPSSIFQTITFGAPDSHIGLRHTEYDFFVNDNWRARPNLTFDAGLRYEYNTVPGEINNRIEDAITLKNVPQPGSSFFDTGERTAAFNAAAAAYQQVLGGRNRIYEPDRNNFGPHLGFAWSPLSDNKTFVRGGFGIYYDAILGAVVSQSRNVFPNEIPINIDPQFLGFNVFSLNNPSFLQLTSRGRTASLIAPGTLNQFGGTPADFVALIGSALLQNQKGGGLAFTLPDKNLRTPYAQQWHLTLERQITNDYLFSIAYVGTKGTKLTRLVTPNFGPNLTPAIAIALGQGAPGVVFPITPTVSADNAASLRRDRPAPALGAFQIFENSAASNYHSLQLEARKRYSHRYTFTAAYTWSHAIDDVSDVFPIAGAPIIAQDSQNLRLDRASANFDIRHRFSASVVWDLPFFVDSNAGAARWLGGWQLASIFQAHTGQPFTLNVPVDANLDGNLTDRPSTTDGLTFFDGHGRQRVTADPAAKIESFFISGQDGAVGRNTVRADGFLNWDVALNKNFRFTERQRLGFRAEFFNALNRANFGTPIRTIGAPGFGSAIDTVNRARTIQFALKYSF